MRPYDTLAGLDVTRRQLDRALHSLQAVEPDRKDPGRPAWETERRALVALYSENHQRSIAVLQARQTLWRRALRDGAGPTTLDLATLLRCVDVTALAPVALAAVAPKARPLGEELAARGRLPAAFELLASKAEDLDPHPRGPLLLLTAALALAWRGLFRERLAGQGAVDSLVAAALRLAADPKAPLPGAAAKA